MAALRRFLLLLAMSFAFGGFLFYAGVVVPIGSRILGATTQGFVTREVTHVLNVASLVAVLFMSWELAASWPGRSQSNRRWLLACVAGIMLSTCALVGLHLRMDESLLVEQMAVLEPEQFYGLHRLYLWISTVQWLVSLPTLWLLVCSQASGSLSTSRN